MSDRKECEGRGGMWALLAASSIWAFSFGLIKHKLVDAGMDPFFVAFVRLALSFLIFVPFLRLRGIGRDTVRTLILIGAVQYGLMYAAYLWSYRFLAAHEVALFTIFTPFYVTLVNDGLARRFHRRSLLCALLAVGGAGLVVFSGDNVRGALSGFVLMQASNLCFALGQVWYRRVGRRVRDTQVFALLYLGALAVVAVPSLVTGMQCRAMPSREKILTLLYLGIVPSGLCFFLWNVGARRCATGRLAAMNNAKIPLAVLCSLLFFGESADLLRLLVGGGAIAVAVIAGVRFNRQRARSTESM